MTKEKRRYFQFVDGAPRPRLVGAVHYVEHDGDYSEDFLGKVYIEYGDSLPTELDRSTLKAFANSEALKPLGHLGGCGLKKENPIIVEVPQIWFQLTNGNTRAPFVGTRTISHSLTEEDLIRSVQRAAFNEYGHLLPSFKPRDLVVYDSEASFDANEPLNDEEQIGSRGRTKDTPLVVVVPQCGAEPTTCDVQVGGWAIWEGALQELQLYQQRGQLIQENCRKYCDGILERIDKYYEDNADPLPFICVSGSWGMGTSQVAFALGGRRPYFYWLGSCIGEGSPLVYTNVASVTAAFVDCMNYDKPQQEQAADVLNTMSDFYRHNTLWTYGFIRALLEHCSLEEHEMILFKEKVTLRVKKCVGLLSFVLLTS